MPTYNTAFYGMKTKLQPLYDEREAAAIAHEWLHHLTGLDRTARLMAKDTLLTEAQTAAHELAQAELASGKPLQYVTGQAWFLNQGYTVTPAVLIPRPETEELAAWIVADHTTASTVSALDIGTGSGCIAISLQQRLPGCTMTACDVSNAALEVAKANAQHLQATINWHQLDFLDSRQHNQLGNYDVIVSNPPYIPIAEQEQLHENVRNHEPHLALFVPDADPLVFYNAIAQFGQEHLNPGGAIYCELDANHALQCQTLFIAFGFADTQLRKDMHGNWRMLRAKRETSTT